MGSILVVDDEPGIRDLVKSMLTGVCGIGAGGRGADLIDFEFGDGSEIRAAGCVVFVGGARSRGQIARTNGVSA